jgi:hypothetical protein
MPSLLHFPAIRRGAPTCIAAAIMFGAMLAAGCSSDNDTTTQTATAVTIVSGNNQSGTVASSLASAVTVQVNDQNGSPVSGVMVTFAATGGATLGSTTATTNSAGQASTSVSLGTSAGSDTVTASIAGVSTPATFVMTANAGAPAAIVVVSGNNQTGTIGTALTSALTVRVNDQYGNAVSGATIDWTTTGGAFAGTTQSVSASDGTVAAALQLPSTPAVVTATATIHGTSIATTFTETAM